MVEPEVQSKEYAALLKASRMKRSAAKSACTRSQTFLNNLEDRVISAIELKQRQTKFRECWQQFEDAQTQIELLQISVEEEETGEEERFAFEEKYFATDAKFEQLIDARSQRLDGGVRVAAGDAAGVPIGLNPFQALALGDLQNNRQNMNMRLPRIELPAFSGAYDEWRPFHDIFKSMIHDNNSVPSIQKFHYLKASLKGEAVDVINALDISEGNYAEAWAMLIERYDNQRMIVQKHIKAIFDQPVLHKENHSELRQLLDNVLKHLRALRVLERPTEQWDDLIVHLIASKLAPITNREWETSLKDSAVPALKTLTEFLTHRCRALEAIDKRPQSSASNYGKTFSKGHTVASVDTNKPACYFCRGDHPIFHCSKFLELSSDRRFQEIRALKLCLNCLKTSEHRAKQCTSGSCKICNKKHNSLLHMESAQLSSGSGSQIKNSANVPIDSKSSVSTPGPSAVHTVMTAGHQVLLSTALVQVRDAKGNVVSCRALLDCGSQSNFVTTDLANRLGLPQRHTCVPIIGVGNSETKTHRTVKIGMQSRFNGFKADLDCLILSKITQDIPVASLDRSGVRIPPGIKLADPDFLQSSQIDMLIGVSTFWSLMCVGQIKATETQPYWQKTHLGWIAAGGVISGRCGTRPTVCSVSVNNDLREAVTRFWEIEHGARNNIIFADERKCEEYYDATVRRNDHGRFIVKLPLKENISRLGQSRETAMRRFASLEKRLNSQPTLKNDYTKFLKEYEALGHLREVQSNSVASWPHYYMPHHCVIKEENLTTKLRVVFDASCKTTSNLSLNDALMVGPTLQQDLFSIIARFRTHRYVVLSDVAKMYRQVLVDESQTALQRIVWRENSADKIKDLELLTVTYGTASAAFLAIKSLRTLAELEAEAVGSAIALRDFYVDDMISGAHSKERAVRIRDEVQGLLAKGGFELRKWASNAPELLESIPLDTITNAVLSLDKEGTFKTLGIQWSPTDDAFQYDIMLDDDQPVRTTKRTVLSCISQIFDPLGLLGPIIISGKILIQKLWALQLDWDETLTTELHTEWNSYKTRLKELKRLQIPRLVLHGEEMQGLELHGFRDASQNAYGACLYVHSTDRYGKHHSELLCSKSRVAPLKAVSLPRLELCGAQLLAQLSSKIVSILESKINHVYYWTDSTIVIDWIKSPSRQFSTFVANRVGEIQELTNQADWKHVRTADNPADALSRGTNPDVFMQAQLWWNGPPWLTKNQAAWPQDNRNIPNSDDLPEQRKTVVVAASIQEKKEDVFHRFSSYVRLVRTIAMCLRFASNARSKRENRVSGPISAEEFDNARKTTIKEIQRVAFAREIDAIRKQQAIPPNSRLLGLNPFLDDEGLLRVGGRLKNSKLPYDAKYPLLLPNQHHFTRLIVEHEHKRCFHAGPQATMAAVRSRYWSIGARKLIRSIVHKCIVCFKARPTSSKPTMGDLPASRITPSRPFNNTGVDYCGPMYVREGKRRNAKKAKAWIAIFVCLATKAVHIEWCPIFPLKDSSTRSSDLLAVVENRQKCTPTMAPTLSEQIAS